MNETMAAGAKQSQIRQLRLALAGFGKGHQVVCLEHCLLERRLQIGPSQIANLTAKSCGTAIVQEHLTHLRVSLTTNMQGGEEPALGKLLLDLRQLF